MLFDDTVMQHPGEKCHNAMSLWFRGNPQF